MSSLFANGRPTFLLEAHLVHVPSGNEHPSSLGRSDLLLLFLYSTISMSCFTITALNFHFAQQVLKNSLLRALIKYLKYLQFQNRHFITEKFYLIIHYNITIWLILLSQVANVAESSHVTCTIYCIKYI